MSNVTERVERGAALLDDKRPGWWQGIDLARLDIEDTCHCICGQLGGYSTVLGAMGIMPDTEECELGFEQYCDGEYAALTEAWRELIVARRIRAQVTA